MWPGYLCANDVTARDIQKGDGQWVRGKSPDTFFPIGPYLVTADEIADPHNLDISLTLNGETRQKVQHVQPDLQNPVPDFLPVANHDAAPRRYSFHGNARRRRRVQQPARVPQSWRHGCRHHFRPGHIDQHSGGKVGGITLKTTAKNVVYGRLPLVGALVLCALMLMLTTAMAQQNRVAKITNVKAADAVEKVILDTDIGDDIDDAYALALLLSRPNIKVLGVTTAWGQTQERAELTVKLLHVMGYDHIPVYAGRRGTATIGRQYEWAKRTEANGGSGKNALPSVQKDDAVTFLKRAIEKSPGEITLIAIGPLVNVGDLVTQHPEVKSKLKRIVIMGGAVHAGYDGTSAPGAEWNIKCDPQAAKAVFSSGIPLTMAGLEVHRDAQVRRGAAKTAVRAWYAHNGRDGRSDYPVGQQCADPVRPDGNRVGNGRQVLRNRNAPRGCRRRRQNPHYRRNAQRHSAYQPAKRRFP